MEPKFVSSSLVVGLLIGLVIGGGVVYIIQGNQITNLRDRNYELTDDYNRLVEKHNNLVNDYNTLLDQAKNIEKLYNSLKDDYNELYDGYSVLLNEKYSIELDYDNIYMQYQKVLTEKEALIAAQNLTKGTWNEAVTFTGSYETSTPLFNLLSNEVRIRWKTQIIGSYGWLHLAMYDKYGGLIDSWSYIHEVSEGEAYLHGVKMGQYYLDFMGNGVQYELIVEIWVPE